MSRWWWLRHGPTHEKAFVGWRDVTADLSDHTQIARLAAHLPGDALVVSSDLRRAIATADAVQGARPRLPHAAELREFNFGDWDGMGFAEVAARDPDLSRAFWERPGDVAAPNGESWNDVAGRVNRFVDAMNARHSGRDIVAVAHIGVIMTQIARARDLSALQALVYPVDNLSVTRLDWDAGGWHCGAINHVP
jgi:alpha-ribazole phosphatase